MFTRTEESITKIRYEISISTAISARRNTAERAIRTFKNHFLSTLATWHEDCPITEWYRLLQQSEMTLNSLLPSRINPKLSSYAMMEGQHDYNKVPLAPPGAKVIVHVKSSQRKSWDYHGKLGWYVGLALDHYRCFRIFMPHTGLEIITDAVKFLPGIVPIPTYSMQEQLLTAIKKILRLLDTNKPSLALPHLKERENLSDAFKAIQKVIHTSSNDPTKQSKSIVKDFFGQRPIKDMPREPRVREKQHSTQPKITIPQLSPMPNIWP